MLGSRAGGYAPLEQGTSLGTTISLLYDGPVDSTAGHSSPEEDEAFRFLTYTCLYSFTVLYISCSSVYFQVGWLERFGDVVF